MLPLGTLVGSSSTGRGLGVEAQPQEAGEAVVDFSNLEPASTGVLKSLTAELTSPSSDHFVSQRRGAMWYSRRSNPPIVNSILTLHNPPAQQPRGVRPRQAGTTVWDVLESLTGTVKGPSDWAAEHDHYIYGTPKRSGRD